MAFVAYALEVDYVGMAFVCGFASHTTIASWKSYFRDVCSHHVLQYDFRQIGGGSMTVEVDESMVFKRKNHLGRLLHNEVEKTWVVGGICRETRETFAVAVQDRSAETLCAVIVEHVAVGSRIITDCWRGYERLAEHDYTHQRVNHSENFVHPGDSTVHTNTIERHWRTLKDIVPAGCHGDMRWGYLAEYMWKTRIGWHSLTVGERIKAIIDALRDIRFL
jgi:hypothetical protein